MYVHVPTNGISNKRADLSESLGRMTDTRGESVCNMRLSSRIAMGKECFGVNDKHIPSNLITEEVERLGSALFYSHLKVTLE